MWFRSCDCVSAFDLLSSLSSNSKIENDPFWLVEICISGPIGDRSARVEPPHTTPSKTCYSPASSFLIPTRSLQYPHLPAPPTATSYGGAMGAVSAPAKQPSCLDSSMEIDWLLKKDLSTEFCRQIHIVSLNKLVILGIKGKVHYFRKHPIIKHKDRLSS